MNKYKLISMGAAACIVIAGCLYLWISKALLLPVLSICALAVCVMGVANAMEVRSAKEKSIIAYIPALCFFVLFGFIVASIVFLLMK